MGGELGTRVAQLIEQRDVGRRHRRRRLRAAPPAAAPRRVPPHRSARRDRLAEFVEEFAPTVVAHFGVYEPASRMTPASAHERTELCTIATMSAAARAGNLEYVVAAQRARGLRPADGAGVGARRRRRARAAHAVRPVAARGRRRSAKGVALRHGVPVCALRYAPVVGLARPEPARAVAAAAGRAGAARSPTRRSRLLHPDDAAEAMVAAIEQRLDGPCNVVGPGAATPWQAARLGGRVPLPVVGPAAGTRPQRVVEIAGAAIAPHVVELLRHGRTGDGGRAVRRARPHAARSDARRAARAVRLGRRRSRSRPAAEAQSA